MAKTRLDGLKRFEEDASRPVMVAWEAEEYKLLLRLHRSEGAGGARSADGGRGLPGSVSGENGHW